MRHTRIIAFLFLITSCISIRTDFNSDNLSSSTDNVSAEAGIRLVLEQQEKAWKNQDLEGVMEGYWKSDQLKFYGSNGLTLGWNKTLANYKKGYPSIAESGTLNFVINDISKIENDSYWVMGEYHLKREIGNAEGVFMIIFKLIDNEWKIVADMSC